MYTILHKLVATVAACAALATASGQVVIDTVTVGNPGNPGELCVPVQGVIPSRVCGAVDYIYQISTFEITAAQYAEFLNAVAASDTYGLYSEAMDQTSDHPLAHLGCNIQRAGAPHSYTYTVPPDWANRPVNCVDWGDAARFCNWLHNGQPTGSQNLNTTEDGSYFLNGATTYDDIMTIVRQPDASWVIPTEDEWYKAAYHKNDGATGNYYDYATATNEVPSHEIADPDPGNNATWAPWPQEGSEYFTVHQPYWRSEVGAHENSPSPYGTFDQSGNIWEWTEAVIQIQPDGYIGRGLRGGGHHDYGLHGADLLSVAGRVVGCPDESDPGYSFRVALLSRTTPLNLNPGNADQIKKTSGSPHPSHTPTNPIRPTTENADIRPIGTEPISTENIDLLLRLFMGS